MKIKLNSGFTLLELMITVAVLTILVGIAVPSYQTFVQNSRLDDAAQKLYSAFNSARQEALVSGQKGFVCRSQDNPIILNNPRCLFGDQGNWNYGLIAYKSLPGQIIPVPNASFGNQRFNSGNFAATTADERVQMTIRNINYQNNGIDFVSNLDDRVVVFNANGTLRNDAPFRIAVCDSRAEAEGKYIEINAVGRVFLKNTTAAGSDTSCSPS